MHAGYGIMKIRTSWCGLTKKTILELFPCRKEEIWLLCFSDFALDSARLAIIYLSSFCYKVEVKMYNEEDLLRASESRNLTHIPFQDFTPGSVTALVG